MGAASALASRARGRSAPNPNVGCVLVKDGRVVGRGWTAEGGRPHAEAVALGQAGAAARGATCYTTLEPCAHESPRGPACADLLVSAGVARVVAALRDPDPRTDGRGLERLAAAGIAVEAGVCEAEARRMMAGFLTRRALGRPHVTLKLATSLDGRIAMASGESRWITGEAARAHVHLERSRCEAILVGRGTWEADRPSLNVRLPGLEGRSPVRVVFSASGERAYPRSRNPLPHPRERGGPSPAANGKDGRREMGPRVRGDDGLRDRDDGQGRDVIWITQPADIATLPGDHLLVEGGAQTAAAFLHVDLVDRLLLYRAPILIGDGLPALGDIGLRSLAEAHGRWTLADARALGSDRVEVYERRRG